MIQSRKSTDIPFARVVVVVVANHRPSQNPYKHVLTNLDPRENRKVSGLPSGALYYAPYPPNLQTVSYESNQSGP